jgi:hypothetical protein
MLAKTSNKHMISRARGRRDWKMNKKTMSLKKKNMMKRKKMK